MLLAKVAGLAERDRRWALHFEQDNAAAAAAAAAAAGAEAAAAGAAEGRRRVAAAERRAASAAPTPEQELDRRRRCGDPTAWTVLRNDGPYHLGLRGAARSMSVKRPMSPRVVCPYRLLLRLPARSAPPPAGITSATAYSCNPYG